MFRTRIALTLVAVAALATAAFGSTEAALPAA